MRKQIDAISKLYKKLASTGFSSIFISSCMSKIVAFLGGVVIVRVLSKSDYGIYTYVINCYGILMLVGDLGCSVSAMQYCNENYKDNLKFDAFFTYGFRQAMLFSGITAVLIYASPYFYPFVHEQARSLTRMLCLMPFINTFNAFILVNLRVRLENKKYAAVSFFSSVIHYAFILPLSYFFNVKGAVISNYAIALSTLAFGLYCSKPLLAFDWNARLQKKEKKSFLKLALASQLNNGIDRGLMLLDVFLIGLIVVDSEVISSYKVATTIPSALAFIPAAVLTYAVPYFARNSFDPVWVEKNYKRLLLGCGVINLLIVVPLILLSGIIVPLIFGRQYTDAVLCFNILTIGYFFSGTFRVTSANVIYTQHKVGVNIAITVISGVLNCILDVVLIKNYASIGAACATTIVNIVASAIAFLYIMIYLKKERQKREHEVNISVLPKTGIEK